MQIRKTAMLAAAICALAGCVEDQTTAPVTQGPSADASVSAPTPTTITLEKIGNFSGGGVGAAEINAYDFVSRRRSS
jgi:hypothetical protein